MQKKKKLSSYNNKRSQFKPKKFFNKKFNIENTYLKLYLYYKYLVKYSLKYSKIPIFNLSNHYRDFRKFQLFFIEPTLLPRSYFLNLPQSISNSNQFFNVNVITKNLNKSCFLSEEVFKKILIFLNFIFYRIYQLQKLKFLNFCKKFKEFLISPLLTP